MNIFKIAIAAFTFLIASNTGWGKKQHAISPSAEPPPNIILIFMDDMGYGDIGPNGGFPYVTKNINRLAAEGMRFTQFYVAQATCTASRAALLTGCYPNRLGVHGAFAPWSPIALNPSEETIAEMLRKRGYHTGMVGKWHLGQKEPYLPLQQGFDEYLGLPYSNDMWPVHYDGKRITDSTNPRRRYPALPLLDGNNKVKELWTLEDQGELTKTYTQRAVNFIRKNKRDPFFLYLAHSMPHVPIAVSQQFKGKSGAGLYGDLMMEIDWSVGEIMKTLDEEKLTRKTIIMFLSDNGPWLTYGNHAGNTGGFREGKGTAWEGGIRVPFVVRWPGKVTGGTICNRMAASMDLLPTIAALTAAGLPAKKIDGVNILPLFMGDDQADPRSEFVYYYDINNLKGIRKGQFKLVFPSMSQTYKATEMGADGFPGKFATDTVPLALYDLRTDPGETVDVQSKYPEVVRQLTAIADKYRKELGDNLTGMTGNEVRPAARVN